MDHRIKDKLATQFLSFRPYINSQLSPRDGIQHTLLGRILFVKSLIGSKLLYTFSMSPSPPDRVYSMLQSMLNKYIWSNGCHYITANLLYQPWDAGGFAMYSCKYQDHSIKLRWLNRLLVENTGFWQKHVTQCFSVPLQKVLQYNGSLHMFVYLLDQPATLPLFWKDVFRIWCSYYCSKHPVNPGNTLLLGNLGVQSRYVEDSILMKTYMRLGVFSISDFLKFSSTCTPLQANSLQVRNILAGIPRS